MIFMVILIFFISLILLFLNLFISKKEILDREKISPFECGFDSLSSVRLPFSIHFYLISLLFLIFDIEVIFLLPIVDLYMNLNLFEWIYLSLIILLILYLGLEFEKSQGSLKWIF